MAAIPNYNMAESLRLLLPQVLEQGYDDVLVLDDASTDHTRDVVSPYLGDVRFLRNFENRGSGATRNLIIGALACVAIVHFIDADMRLDSERIPEVASYIMNDSDFGFVGGLVRNTSGRQIGFNYGPRMCLRNSLVAQAQNVVSLLAEKQPQDAFFLRRNLDKLLADWPDPTMPPKEKQTFWVSEANMLIRSDLFEHIGGFDPHLRDHDIQDLAIRMHNKGLERRFIPLFAATHRAVQVRKDNRNRSMAKAEMYIARKHGIRNYLRPEGHWKPSL